MSNPNRTLFSRLDALTFALYISLVLIGLVAVYSVEYKSTDVGFFTMGKNYTSQTIFFGLSLFVGLIILFTDSKAFASLGFLSYLIGILLLIITIFASTAVKGSHSWLVVGGIRVQPGEVCKIFTALAIAKFISLPETNFKTMKDRAIGIAIALLPAVIIILQNETGLALVYFSFILAMYREGLPNSILIVGFSVVVLGLASLLLEQMTLFIILTSLLVLSIYFTRRQFMKNGTIRLVIIGSYVVAIGFSQFAIPFAFKKVLQNYQIERIYSMLGTDVPEEFIKVDNPDPDAPPPKKKDYNYNVNQSKIAIGSGGFLGKGLGNGTSTKNDFVPEQHTDFIFCAIGEQFGFVGSTLLILIYISLMIRISILAERQRSTFSRVYAYCVASILFFHFAINISMTIGLAPVIGITLPLLSYGGSSLLSFSILIFILLRLDADRQVLIR